MDQDNNSHTNDNLAAGVTDAVETPSGGAWPRSVLVIGCGLLGMSLALAIKSLDASRTLVGVEPNRMHRSIAAARGGFDDVLASMDDAAQGSVPRYDLCILAAPLNASCALVATAARLCDVVMDICSAKEAICDQAAQLGLTHQFAPTHPMAGLAAEGPAAATSDLFHGCNWIVLDGWPACSRITPLLTALGARIVHLPSAIHHDVAMAAVSHGIHVTSLSAMLAYQDAESASGAHFAHLTGPGFRDITRLAASPTEFWADVLIANTSEVRTHLHRIIERLQQFSQVLDDQDREGLAALLDEARRAHTQWLAQHRY